VLSRGGRIIAFFGKPDVAQGVDMARGLDVAVDRVAIVGDTALT
jgi:hypothetical protein